MKIGRLLCMALLMSIMVFFTSLHVRAANYDDVTVNYVYEYRNSVGEITKVISSGESYSFTVNQSIYKEITIYAPSVPTGYSFSNVLIESQSCSNHESISRFVNAGFTDSNKNNIRLTFNGMDNDLDNCHRRLILRIVCKVNQYQVTFDYNGGQGNKNGKSVYYGETYGTLPMGDRNGTAFRGWSLDIDGNTIVDENTIVTTAGNHTLYAQWSYQKYRVTFNPNGGECGTSSNEVGFGEKYRLPSAERDGYSFAGWYTSPAGGSLVTSDTVMNRAEDHTLFAHWSNNSLNVSFDANGGMAGKENKQVTYLGTYGSLPDAARAGFSFVGWFTEREGGDEVRASSVVNVSKPHTLFAHWAAVSYSATYDSNGGTCDKNAKTVFYGEPYGSLAVPERVGATFKGWSLDIDGNRMIDESTPVTTASDHKLYAQWSNNIYEVTLDANGGECAVGKVSIVYGKKYSGLASAVREGYTFLGWFTKQDGGLEITSKTTMDRAENHTLYAHWKNNSFDVVFDGNGGIVKGTKKQVTYLGTYGTLPTADRTGYTFTGWYTSRTEGNEITASSTVDIPHEHTLYAHWKANSYVILFDGNGGTCDVEKIDVTYESPYGQLPIPQRVGYTFAGWYLEKELITEDSIVYVTEQTTLKANWSANHYEIGFDPNDGECEMKYKEVVYDDTYGELPVPVRTGYTFKGWFIKNELITAESLVAITVDTDLIAKWSPNYYKITFNANGGECSATEWTYAYDDLYTEFPSAIKDFYTFEGWYTSKEGGMHYTEDMKVTILEDMTLYAHWKKIEVIEEDDWYIYPTTPDKNEDKHEMTIDEAAAKYGYSPEQIRNIMNMYQLTSGVAGNLLTRATELGADYKLITSGLDNIEKKKSGNDLAGTTYQKFMARTKTVTKDSIKITWNRVAGADGYIVYASKCGNKNTFSFEVNTKKRAFAKYRLDKGTYYRFIVVAYSVIDGKQIPIAVSKNVHAVTKGGKFGNVKKITVNKTKKTLYVGKSFRIKTKLKYGKKKKHMTHRKLSYESSNPEVATVDSKGVVQALSEGQCTIFVFDQSGKCRKVNITVIQKE